MKYRDRKGNEYEHTTSQDMFLEKVYGNVAGRAFMKVLSMPVISVLSRYVLDSKLSKIFIYGFAERNNIDLFDYEDREFNSFNDFFTRRIKKGRRLVDSENTVVVSPSDGKVSAYEITDSAVFTVKNSVYTIESLLRDQKLAKKYRGGTALIIRLSVDDYHRYCYCVDGKKSHDRRIDGVLHTVNPVINKHYPVYKENSREYCMIRTENFGDIIQMEVGATLVGKITNSDSEGNCKVVKGEEKGYFEFGGSTIILLFEKDKVKVDSDLLENTYYGYETKVFQGERIAVKS